MELKNANPNDCHVLIDNLHLLFFFPKILKIDLNKGLQIYLRVQIP